jgi:hypothetical protein
VLIAVTAHEVPTTMQELVGKGCEAIVHLQQRDNALPEHMGPKAPCITASGARSENKLRVNGVERVYYNEELELLQTLPKGYTKAAVSDTNRADSAYLMSKNGPIAFDIPISIPVADPRLQHAEWGDQDEGPQTGL